MIKFLLDTNVVCEATAKEPNKKVMDWIDRYAETSGISCMTIGEVWKGLGRLPEGKRRRSLIHWMEELEKDFSDRIIPLDSITLKVWGKFYAKHESKGRNMDVLDSLIAATALVHDLTVITRNTRDFPSEIKCFNPWL
jgi:predicted nucleic acid-binding protein